MTKYFVKTGLLAILMFLAGNIFAQNLLINPGAETGTTEGWVDVDDVWGAASEITPQEGSYFFWPSRGNLPFTQLYQDVDVTGYSSQSYFHLSGWLANWDQYPHDKATLAVAVFDINGNQLFYAAREHRNPIWGYYEINSQLPVGAKTIRVYLISTRFVGADNDGYFDDLSLEIKNETPSIWVNITSDSNKNNIEIDSTLQLTAETVGGNDSSYNWSSSYDEIASVDENGLVTAHTSGSFTIQAIGNETQTIGHINLVSHPQNYLLFIYPDGEDELVAESSIDIEWEVIGSVGFSTLYWSSNDGAEWFEISSINPTDKKFTWDVPATSDAINNCVLKIEWAEDKTISARFSIVPTVTSVENKLELPKEFLLSQNYPNPFNPSTTISYQISESANVSIIVYDVLGHEIKELVNGFKQPGNYQINFEASGLSSGIYFYTLKTGNKLFSRKMLLLK